MMNVYLYSIVLLLMMLILMMLMYIISYKSMMDREKNSPFECGFDPFESSRIPFSSHFFLIAVIFLIFDVELVIIMPMIIIIPMLNMMYLYTIMTLYLIILLIGLYHEWYNKMLDWV
uniref:NADH-ubiquinone oxidoreductase chain 3 n=1 Tax=Planopleura kaempferi TaxID=3381683 RepID=A0A343J8E6_9HEMI|nr:NADH dehydrogenase subunit 3 [Platypleura kaempferi]AWV83360.1 NADH dehydrogenase subunit 3 [Platypleura kaempferi]AWV84478.1 NADH dehydrogenase subunit 3 [Platypleura kaempferi]